jgi:hypothetical protein
MVLERDKRLVDFALFRYPFEEFLVRHRHFINELSHSKGSRLRPVESFTAMYEIVLAQVKQESDAAQIIEALHKDTRLKDLSEVQEDDQKYRQKFSRDAKSAAYLRDAIDTPVRCAICKARLHSRSMSADHDTKMEHGGQGDPGNLRSLREIRKSFTQRSQSTAEKIHPTFKRLREGRCCRRPLPEERRRD